MLSTIQVNETLLAAPSGSVAITVTV